MLRSLHRCAVALCLTAPALTAQSTTRFPVVASAGQGAETFVLVTGMVGGLSGFRRLETALVGAGYRVIVVDPYALSLDSTDVTFLAMARRIEAVLDAEGVTVARVVAHSQGAGVALRLAAIAPERVSALYFLDSGALPAQQGPTLSASLRLVPIITRLPGGTRLVRDRFLDGIRRNAGRQEWLDAETQRAYTDPMLASVDRVVAMAFRLAKAVEPESLSTVVARVRAPVTVVLGGAKHEADVGPEELNALSPLGTRLRIERLPGVGHFPHEEAPDELLPLLVRPLVARSMAVARATLQ
jgi:pimeloyl-ACP methyl ester carboxylesterase